MPGDPGPRGSSTAACHPWACHHAARTQASAGAAGSGASWCPGSSLAWTVGSASCRGLGVVPARELSPPVPWGSCPSPPSIMQGAEPPAARRRLLPPHTHSLSWSSRARLCLGVGAPGRGQQASAVTWAVGLGRGAVGSGATCSAVGSAWFRGTPGGAAMAFQGQPARGDRPPGGGSFPEDPGDM